MDNEYELRYLPLFYEDMYEKISYIKDKLLNPEAAEDLIDAVEKAILERLPNCESLNRIVLLKNVNIRIIGYM